MCPGLWRPGVFLRHELIVYIITHFWSLSSPQQRNKQDAYQNHYSQVWKAVTFACHLRMCHFFCLPALSHLLAHFAWAGEICATCQWLPVWPWDWWNTFWEKVMLTDRVFTSFCVGKKGQWPLINTIFTHWAEKDKADSISENIALYRSPATVNKLKTEKINLSLYINLNHSKYIKHKHQINV